VARIEDLSTPCLLLRRQVLAANCARMATRMDGLGVALRPHMKTAKSAAVAALATRGQDRPITVSTLAEAAYFLDAGFDDITYAVGIIPQKLAAAAELQGRGARLTMITDNLEGVTALSEEAARLGASFDFLIEIDCGAGRAGLPPASPAVLELGRRLQDAPGLSLKGVLTHAGHSYGCRSSEEVVAVAEEERSGAVQAAEALRAAGLPAPVVSVGSTPTALHAARLHGVTEMRPGVYMLGDLDQMALGSCSLEEIAAGVLARVIGHNRQAGHLLIDAGGLALSKDLSANRFLDNVGYGRLCDRSFTPLTERLYLAEAHQEHGMVKAPGGAPPPFERYPLGSEVVVLPNHICMTAAAYDGYHVVNGAGEVEDFWPRATGW